MNTRTVALVVVAVCFAVGVVLAADATVGTWKVNVAKSKYSPGPPPKASSVKIEAVGADMKVTVDTTNADGTTLHSEWVGKYDGKDYAVKGDPNIDMRSYKMINDLTFESVNKKAGKVTTSTKSVYNKDGKGRTSTQTGTNPQGQKVNNTIVYDKQ